MNEVCEFKQVQSVSKNPIKPALTFILFMFYSVSCLAETIVWYKINRPPWFSETGDGYGDFMQTNYEALLPEYQHVSRRMNLARFYVEIQSESPFCIASLAKIPPLMKHVHFSKTTYLLPPPKIFMKTRVYQALGKPKTLSLNSLAQNANYKLALAGGTQHLPIDLAELSKFDHVSIISTDYPLISIIRMMDAGRIDWSADFPHMIQWGTQSGNIPLESPLHVIDIEELTNEGEINAGIACAKTDWGQSVVRKLNSRISDSTLENNLEIVSRWMPPGSVMDEFYRLNQTLFSAQVD